MERSRRPHWLIAAVSVLVLVPAVAACRPTTSEDTGHLTGVVYTRGGVIGTEPAEATITATPTGGDTSQTHTTETAGDGSFSLDLPAGTYELTGTLTARNRGDQVTPDEVTITDGHSTTADLFASYP